MTNNYFYNFKKSLHEAEVDAAEDSVEQQSDLEKVLKNSPKVAYTLMRLLTSQTSVNQKAQDEIREIVSDIKVISYRPTTFRIIFKNSNYFDLVYDPTPEEVKNEKRYKPTDFFRAVIAGKRYDLSNNSAFEQTLDYIGQALKYNPIDSNNPDEQQAATSSPEEADLPVETEKPAK